MRLPAKRPNGGINYPLAFDDARNVGVGTTNPTYKLDDAGDTNTTGDIRKSGTAYTNPGYVFESDYEMLSLVDFREHLSTERHLPGMPSTEEVQEQGVQLFEQNRLLLVKLEEAYLYILQLEERVSRLEETDTLNKYGVLIHIMYRHVPSPTLELYEITGK